MTNLLSLEGLVVLVIVIILIIVLLRVAGLLFIGPVVIDPDFPTNIIKHQFSYFHM
jgi:hypothetical protein